MTERVTSVSVKFKCVLSGFKWYFISYTGMYSEENKTKNDVVHFKLIHGGMLPCFIPYYFKIANTNYFIHLLSLQLLELAYIPFLCALFSNYLL